MVHLCLLLGLLELFLADLSQPASNGFSLLARETLHKAQHRWPGRALGFTKLPVSGSHRFHFEVSEDFLQKRIVLAALFEGRPGGDGTGGIGQNLDEINDRVVPYLLLRIPDPAHLWKLVELGRLRRSPGKKSDSKECSGFFFER